MIFTPVRHPIRDRWPDLFLDVLFAVTAVIGGMVFANYTQLVHLPQGLASARALHVLFAGFLLCAFALICFFWHYAEIGKARKRWLRAVVAEGTVIAVDHGMLGSGGSGSVHFPIVRYSGVGSEREGKAALPVSRSPKIGSRVQLRYDPQEPDWFAVERTDPAKSLLVTAWLTGGLAVFAVVRTLVELI